MKYTRAPADGQINWAEVFNTNDSAATPRVTPVGVPLKYAKEWRVQHPYDARPIYTNDPFEVQYYRTLKDFVVVPLYAEFDPPIPEKAKRA